LTKIWTLGQLFPRLNEHFDVKHDRDDLNLGGLKDPPVYDLAVAQARILITLNGDTSDRSLVPNLTPV
jgi:hypothetical protein